MTTTTTATDAARPNKSTNVRSLQWAAARLGTRSLQTVSPTLAGRTAARLFTTTQRVPRPAAERQLLETGERISVPGDLAAWSFGAGAETVLLVHGWNGRGAQLGAFVAPLVQRGRRVIAFDAPAHGDSPGRTTTIIHMAAAIRDVAEAVSGVSAVVAHSLGGAATTVALSRGLALEQAVYVASPVMPHTWIARLAEALGLGEAARHAMVRAVEARAGAELDAVDVLSLARSMRTKLLIAHDRGDCEVPWQAGHALSESWPGAALVSTEGLGHRRILRDPAVIEAAVTFLTERRTA